MTGLLLLLQRHHHWRLQLWHGDHGWRPESALQAEELGRWAAARGLPFSLERQSVLPSGGNREAIARQWRYGCLARQALRHGCSHVLTAHTASDRAETVLLHLARGSHQRGLASLRSLQPLAPLLAVEGPDPAASGWVGGAEEPSGRRAAAASQGDPGLAPRGRTARAPAQCQLGEPAALETPALGGGSPRGQAEDDGGPVLPGMAPLWLVRPLQIFSRQDTARLCDLHGWPVWIDPGNGDQRLSRNRIRAAVLPVLEELHPGAARRISAQAERLAGEVEQRQELLDLALTALASGGDNELDRQALLRLSATNQGSLLQHWLRQRWGRELDASTMQNLLPRLPRRCGPGHLDLAGGWQLRWQGSKLALIAPSHPHEPSHG